MTTKWYETQAVEEWVNSEINGEHYKQVLKVMTDELMMKLAACSTAAYEGYRSAGFYSRVKQILASNEEREDAAMFLVYHRALDYNKAEELLQQQYHKKQFHEKRNQKKERNMNSPQQTENPLTEKQIEYAQRNKNRVLQDVEEFKQYLQKQDNPEWWLKRRFFSFAANSFNKHKRDSFMADQKNSLDNKASISENMPQMNTQTSGQKI